MRAARTLLLPIAGTGAAGAAAAAAVASSCGGIRTQHKCSSSGGRLLACVRGCGAHQARDRATTRPRTLALALAGIGAGVLGVLLASSALDRRRPG
jgi:hypothetical protein